MEEQTLNGGYLTAKQKLEKIKLNKPIDIILNPRFKNGVFLKPKRAVEVYDGEMRIEKQESAFPDFKPVTCDICKGDLKVNGKCSCFRKQYKNQRKLKPSDGMLYYYQKNYGKLPADISEIQQPHQEININQNNINITTNNECQDLRASSKKNLLLNKQNNHIKNSGFNKIQMLICVTMYNEPFEMLERTLGGIQQNLMGFQKLGFDPKNFAVVVLQDGIEKMNDDTRDHLFKNWIDRDLNLDGFDFNPNIQQRVTDNLSDQYEKELALLKTKTVQYRLKMIQQARNEIDQKKLNKDKYIKQNNNFPGNVPKNVAQLYQTELDFIKHQSDNFKLTTFFCNKHLNGRKLSSHLWFFQGFCRLLQPKYLALVDVGTMPDPMGLVNYFKSLEADPRVGGVSGFMGLYFEQKNEEYTKYEIEEMKHFNKTCEEWAYMEESERTLYVSELRTVQTKLDNQKQLLEQKAMNELQQQGEKTWLQKYSLNNSIGGVCKEFLKDWKNFNTTTDQLEHEKSIAENYVKYKDEILKNYKNDQYINLKAEERKQQLEFEKDKGVPSCLDKIGQFILKLLYCIFYKMHTYFDVKKAQVFEYALAHYMDKNFESFFGFLQVLPGAWSCYRYEALNKAQAFKENLVERKYLKGVLNPNIDPSKLSLEENNMYLAEDRILCLGIFAQPDFKYSLKYVPTARAYTDAIDNNIEFMLQRRRWINSTWFALNYVTRNYKEHMKNSKHGWIKKNIGIPIMMFMTTLGQLNAYLLVGFFSFALYASATQLFIPIIEKYNVSSMLKLLPLFFLICYCLIVIFLLYLSLNIKINKNNNSHKLYGFISGIFGIYNFSIYIIIIYNIIVTYLAQDPIFSYQNQTDQESEIIKTFTLVLIIVSMGTIGFMIIIQGIDKGSIGTIVKMFLSVPSYLYYSAMYTHTLLLYAFSNIDDFTWGTKGESSQDDKTGQSYRDFKIFYMAKWIFWNSLLCFTLIVINDYFGGRGYVLLSIGAYAAFQLGFKFIFSIINHFQFYLWDNLKSVKNQKSYSSIGREIQNIFQNNGNQANDDKKQFNNSLFQNGSNISIN